MTATIDQDACIGCGLCVDTCPTVFVMEGDVAAIQVDEVAADAAEDCRAAADGCPVDCITVDD